MCDAAQLQVLLTEGVVVENQDSRPAAGAKLLSAQNLSGVFDALTDPSAGEG